MYISSGIDNDFRLEKQASFHKFIFFKSGLKRPVLRLISQTSKLYTVYSYIKGYFHTSNRIFKNCCISYVSRRQGKEYASGLEQTGIKKDPRCG
jgi:hypothetical protein